MSCVPSNPRFRLLDYLVGWEADDIALSGLTGFDLADGVRLKGGTHGLSPEIIDPFIPPPALSPGCNPCDWFLATHPAPESRIVRLDACSNLWHPAWSGAVTMPVHLVRAVALDVDRHRIAIADAGTDRIWILSLGTAHVLGEAQVERPRDLSSGPSGELVVAADAGDALVVFAQSGRPLGDWPTPLPAGRIARVAHDRDGRLWLVMETALGDLSLFMQASPKSGEFRSATATELAAAFERTSLVRSDADSFLLSRGGPDGAYKEICYDFFGFVRDDDCAHSGGHATYLKQGQLLTQAIDSGLPRCRWHRIRVDADIPIGSTLSVAVATSETGFPGAQGSNTIEWDSFPDGIPHPADWQEMAPGVIDALIRQPAGRFLFLRLRLSGDGTVTPRIRRIHIDFPRGTSADLLPAIYRQDSAAGEFTERFLSLFDAGLETIDATVARFPALLNSADAPEEVLPWIARFLSITLDESWDTATRRRMLKNAPEMFRRRGTLSGMRQAIELAYRLAAPPAIVEHGANRAWGAVASSRGDTPAASRLGHTRLFSKSQARMTLGTSRIGTAPVMSYGDPVADPHSVGAFRFSVSLPPGGTGSNGNSLARLIDGLKPAHTVATLRAGGEDGFLLGIGLQLGIDTIVTRPVPKALGDPDLRLSGRAVLGGQPRPGIVLETLTLSSSHSCTELTQ